MRRASEYRVLRAFSSVAGRLPWGAGQFRVASRYAARTRWPAGSYAEQRLRCGALVRLDLADRTQAIAFLVRDYSPALTQYMVGRLPRRGTFFDVGGNVGLISFAVSTLRPDVSVHAFEPNPANASAWRHNQRLNRADGALLLEAAASDRVGRVEFTVPSDSGSGTVREGGGQSVATTTLDRYCAEREVGHIDVLKIDVEGHEASVLRGARGLLEQGAVSTIVCEIGRTDGDAIEALLCGHGYKAVGLPAVGLRRLIRGSPGSADDGAYERS